MIPKGQPQAIGKCKWEKIIYWEKVISWEKVVLWEKVFSWEKVILWEKVIFWEKVILWEKLLELLECWISPKTSKVFPLFCFCMGFSGCKIDPNPAKKDDHWPWFPIQQHLLAQESHCKLTLKKCFPNTFFDLENQRGGFALSENVTNTFIHFIYRYHSQLWIRSLILITIFWGVLWDLMIRYECTAGNKCNAGDFVVDEAYCKQQI